jgi:hypothetical protein
MKYLCAGLFVLQKRYDAYLDRIASLNRSVHVVYFEDMQINLETVVEVCLMGYPFIKNP